MNNKPLVRRLTNEELLSLKEDMQRSARRMRELMKRAGMPLPPKQLTTAANPAKNKASIEKPFIDNPIPECLY